MIDAKTKICCIIGDPVEHSLSPIMHNAGYKSLHLNFAFVAFHVKNVKDAIAGIRSLGIRGTSVTVPHKRAVIPFLNEVEKTAKRIGAVNTIVNKNGILKGYNTDSDGAIKALEEKTTLKNKKVILVGAGGGARSIVYGLGQKGADVLVLNRTIENAKELAEKADASFGDLSKLSDIAKADILIHATPTGMHPNDNDTLIPKKYLRKELVVFDIVYNPKETRLIKDAKELGCQIIYGYKMLLYQAVCQFQLFTEEKAPVAIMEKELLLCLDS